VALDGKGRPLGEPSRGIRSRPATQGPWVLQSPAIFRQVAASCPWLAWPSADPRPVVPAGCRDPAPGTAMAGRGSVKRHQKSTPWRHEGLPPSRSWAVVRPLARRAGSAPTAWLPCLALGPGILPGRRLGWMTAGAPYRSWDRVPVSRFRRRPAGMPGFGYPATPARFHILAAHRGPIVPAGFRDPHTRAGYRDPVIPAGCRDPGPRKAAQFPPRPLSPRPRGPRTGRAIPGSWPR